jgi:hypothetical protein
MIGGLCLGAFFPHVVNCGERGECLVGNNFRAKIALRDFITKAGRGHTAGWKRDLRGHIEPQWRRRRDRLR